MSELKLHPGSVTAPVHDPIEYAVWLLTEHPEIYREFRKLCDEYLRNHPDAAISARMVCQVIRWNTGMRAKGDVFKINNNATPLLARLYVYERPQYAHNIRSRRSVYDRWQDQAEIVDAFNFARNTRLSVSSSPSAQSRGA